MNEDFESYSIEDDEEGDIRPREPKTRLTMWSIVPRIMIMPASGWEKARNNGPLPEIAALRFLLPLCLLSGASVFFAKLYPTQDTFTSLLTESVISFFAYFLGYYIAILAAKTILPKEARGFPLTDYGRLLIMTGVATLAFFHILFAALPMLDFIFEFLPLWTIYLVYRGMSPEETGKERYPLTLAVMCIIIICCPYLVEWVFNLFV